MTEGCGMGLKVRKDPAGIAPVGCKTLMVEMQAMGLSSRVFECFRGMLLVSFRFDSTHAATDFDFFLPSFCQASAGILGTMVVRHDTEATGRLLEQAKVAIANERKEKFGGGNPFVEYMGRQGVEMNAVNFLAGTEVLYY